MAKKPASKPKREKPWLPKSASWAPNGDLLIVAARGPEARVFHLRDRRVIAETPAVNKALWVAASGDRGFFTIARDGTTQYNSGDGASAVPSKLGWKPYEIASVGGVAWAGGARTFGWIDQMRFNAEKLPYPKGADDADVSSIIEADGNQPLVAVHANAWTYLYERTGTDAWESRGKLPPSNAICRAPDGRIFAVGSHVWCTDGTKYELGDDAWSCAWIGDALYITSGAVMRMSAAGVPTVVLVGEGGEPHQHSFVSNGTRASYVCGKNVFVISPDGVECWFGEDPHDPVKIAARTSAIVDKARVSKAGVMSLYSKDIPALPPSFAATHAQVVDLNLSHNALIALPDDFGALANLKKLNLHLNAVSALPASFAQLANLEELDLGMNTCLKTNDLVGALPMKVVPPEIRALKKLRVLDIAMNELSELPDWFAELTELERLDMSSNRFTVFPDVLLKLPKLHWLSVGYQPWSSGVTPLVDDKRRPLKGLAKVCKITTLRELYIDRLDLEKVPDDIGNLTELQVLSIAFDERITTLPASFYTLAKLETLFADCVPFDKATKSALAKKRPKLEIL